MKNEQIIDPLFRGLFMFSRKKQQKMFLIWRVPASTLSIICSIIINYSLIGNVDSHPISYFISYFIAIFLQVKSIIFSFKVCNSGFYHSNPIFVRDIFDSLPTTYFIVYSRHGLLPSNRKKDNNNDFATMNDETDKKRVTTKRAAKRG